MTRRAKGLGLYALAADESFCLKWSIMFDWAVDRHSEGQCWLLTFMEMCFDAVGSGAPKKGASCNDGLNVGSYCGLRGLSMCCCGSGSPRLLLGSNEGSCTARGDMVNAP